MIQVNKEVTNKQYCIDCNSQAVYTVTLNDTTIHLCEDCKHNLTYELISN